MLPKPHPALRTPALHSLTCVNTASSSQGSWEHAAEAETAAPGEEGTMSAPTAKTGRAGRAMPEDHSLDSKWRGQSIGKEISPLDLRHFNCCCSVAKSCLTLQPHGLQHPRLPCPSFTIFQSSLKLMSTESVMLSNHLILCHPLLLLPSIFPGTRVFSDESAHSIRWPKY